MDKHQELIKKAQLAVQSKQDKMAKDVWRLNYHISPPAGWMNDPNGFCYFRGEYHLFYQHYPYDSVWGPMHWGHVKSKDAAVWEHLPIALAPSEGYDQDGCFSGSAIQQGNQLVLMYTGHVWTGEDHEHDLMQTQCLAVSEDGIHFTKSDRNPVISQVPEGDIHPHHFRDPKVWKQADQYYSVIGSKTLNNRGQALLYRSGDLGNWQFVSVVAQGQGNCGTMWECPDLFHLDGKDVLIISPQGMKPEGTLYRNVHQSGYVLGTLDLESGLLDHGPFQLLDYGFDFYAPQTTLDDQGRRVMVAWMNMWESEMPEQKHGWAGAMTIPRILTIEEGSVRIRPVPELERLRTEPITLLNQSFTGMKAFPAVEGSCIEMKLTVDLKEAKGFQMKLRLDAKTGQETVIRYDVQNKLLSFNRDKSGAGPKGVRQAHVDLVNHRLSLHLFLDHSSLELFVNDGDKVMTGRIYPDEQATKIEFFSDEEVEITELHKWNLKA